MNIFETTNNENNKEVLIPKIITKVNHGNRNDEEEPKEENNIHFDEKSDNNMNIIDLMKSNQQNIYNLEEN